MILQYYKDGETDSVNDYVLSNLSSAVDGVEINTDKGIVKYNGHTWSISEIIGSSTTEQKTLASNGVVEVIESDSETIQNLIDNEKVRMVVVSEEDADNANPTYAVIPEGFYYVTGTPSTGLVVSDVDGDDDDNSKGGNQFVWVPCNGDSGVTYETTLASTWTSKYKNYQSYYTVLPAIKSITEKDDDGNYKVLYEEVNISDCWSDDGGNATSVATYGGFYVARYEAGVPEDASFYSNTDGATYTTSRDVTTYTPVSKKGVQSWNYISQTSSKTVSANMYTDTSTYAVTSSLIDSYAWDTIEEWMNKTVNGIATDSTNRGNYANSTNITGNGLYSLHVNKTLTTAGSAAVEANTLTSTAGWKIGTAYGSKYKIGSVTGGTASLTSSTYSNYDVLSSIFDDGFTNYSYTLYKEFGTGISESTNINNIYDMAGNMWEWTTETGQHYSSSQVAYEVENSGSTATKGTYAVRRGGSFSYSGSGYPLSCRNGYVSASADYYIFVGFRVVLYIE